MRYVILGAGAIGATIGGRLAEAGCSVMLVGRGEHAAVVKRDGLLLAMPDRTVQIPVPMATMDELRLAADQARKGMDVAFIVMLFLTSLTGLLLLLLRETSAMGPLLAVHIGVVFALFITMPYGKFVHGIYRFVALVRYARERQMMVGGAGE